VRAQARAIASAISAPPGCARRARRRAARAPGPARPDCHHRREHRQDRHRLSHALQPEAPSARRRAGARAGARRRRRAARRPAVGARLKGRRRPLAQRLEPPAEIETEDRNQPDDAERREPARRRLQYSATSHATRQSRSAVTASEERGQSTRRRCHARRRACTAAAGSERTGRSRGSRRHPTAAAGRHAPQGPPARVARYAISVALRDRGQVQKRCDRPRCCRSGHRRQNFEASTRAPGTRPVTRVGRSHLGVTRAPCAEPAQRALGDRQAPSSTARISRGSRSSRRRSGRAPQGLALRRLDHQRPGTATTWWARGIRSPSSASRRPRLDAGFLKPRPSRSARAPRGPWRPYRPPDSAAPGAAM